jgi:hypothetical protein
MIRSKRARVWFVFAALMVGIFVADAALAQQIDPLEQGFKNPPNGARPRVWWHWMNGNITKEGIKLDLEWMKRVGLGGFQNFDAALNTPQVVDHRLAYMTPEWNDAFRYATVLADSLGLEEAIAGSPGWSETGGPWVPASQGMKKYVWSETRITGGKPFTGTLAKPPSNTGRFQGLSMFDVMPTASGTTQPPSFYADSAVIAYRAPASERILETQHSKITVSSGSPDLAILSESDLSKSTRLPRAAVGSSAWIQYEFDKPQTIRAATLALLYADPASASFGGARQDTKELQVSDDGVAFRTVATFPNDGTNEHTLSFSPVSARFFRFSFLCLPQPVPVVIGSPSSVAPAPKPYYEIAKMVLHPGARVNRFEEKAAFATLADLYSSATPAVASSDAINKKDVVDLTAKMRPDGTLNWNPPAGEWVVLRFGYSLTGKTNHPATAEATGLEVDKLNRTYVKNYMDHYLDSYKNVVGSEMMGKRGLKYVITDSWEAGTQNWTDEMIAEFTRRRGYDPRPWMPVLAGYVVSSAAESDAFLWDFRKTIADLTSDEHYGQIQDSLKERGLGHYSESHEVRRAFIGDGMEVKKLADIPMSAMWTQQPGVNKDLFGFDADDRESASVAHIYGQNIAAAESMTARYSPWAWSPATLKPTADKELAEGINRFVIHCSTHQPLIGKAPGLGLGIYGQWFNRNETWAEQAGPWVDYLARSSYMLQQGHFGADLLYYYGEDSNLTAIFANKLPDVPEGYGFDYVNADALEHEFSVQNGQITTKSGMSYRLLALDEYSKHMSLPVLRSIKTLVEQGAIVVGAKPVGSPSKADDAAAYRIIVDGLWGNGTGVRTVGKGKVYAGMPLAVALAAMRLEPDFQYTKPQSDSNLLFVHRKLTDGDIYFVDNRTDRDQTLDATFRVSGKTPELWRAETATREPASYTIANGKTTVPLHLEPWGSVFVVFRSPSTQTSRVLPKVVENQLGAIDGSWQLSFQSGRGAPSFITLDKLISWSESADSGVKYFSGIGTYSKTINAPESWFKSGSRLWLDLGKVNNLAEVTVNGKPLGIVWHEPYRVDVTEALKPGTNEVVIRVTNAWVNRLIGDQQPDAKEKITFEVLHPYNANSPLQTSGLLGPVAVVRTVAE